MSGWNALVLGIIEGVTEFLPVSSTGHLILASKLLGIPESEFIKSFEIVIQLGAILAVVVLYWKRIFSDLRLMGKIGIAFIPTAVIGLLSYKWVKKYLLANADLVLWTLFLGGVFLIIFEFWHKKHKESGQDIESLSISQLLAIGVFQSVAIIPGISRSACTIIGGLILGLNRKTIVEFSFLLAIPTMAAATGLDLIKSSHAFTADQFVLLAVGFVTSFITAIFSIRFLLGYIRRHDFTGFGVYRILAACIFWAFISF